MDKSVLKQAVIQEIDRRKEELIAIGNALYDMPETGFREYRTSAYTEEVLRKLGLSVETEIAVTGLKAKAEGRSHDRCVGIMGELDALIMPTHCRADAQTGNAHACGHHAQIAMMLGAAIGLVESGVVAQLDGDVAFLAVPAEEIIELEWRQEQIRAGKLRYVGGKQEFIRLGALEDVDAVLGSHLSTTGPRNTFRHSASYNGVINKSVRFTGKSAHAANVDLGINALHAAVQAINNLNALRDTLPVAQTALIHYIITKGGDSPNIIPDDVRMEVGVRAASVEYMLELSGKVDRAIRAGADALGAQVEIADTGAYLPTRTDRAFNLLFEKNAEELVGEGNVIDASDLHRRSSTDVGEIASYRPVSYSNFGGAVGTPHMVDFDVVDPEFAYVEPAKAMALTVIDLLADGGRELDRIKAGYKPLFPTREDYVRFYDELIQTN